LGEPDGGEFETIRAFLCPPHNGLINAHRPLVIF
jgi:hypothetical protein